MDRYVDCSRCHAHTIGMPHAPFPSKGPLGDLGSMVFLETCSACWQLWLQASIKLVNELRLDLTQHDARTRWITAMKSFLNLDGHRADPWLRFLDASLRVELLSAPSLTGVLVAMDERSLVVVDAQNIRHTLDRDRIIELCLSRG